MDDMWCKSRVFITGCTGFIGCWLADALLQKGASVTGLVRDCVADSPFFQTELNKKINIVNGGLEDFPLLERSINEYDIDTVFHLGAQTQVGVGNRNPLSTFEANIRGTWNILEACRLNKNIVQRIIIASSDKAYGDQDTLPYTEGAPLHGSHPYDVSKSCADLISYAYYNTYGLPVCITRCGNIFGPGDLNYNRLIPGTILSVLKNEPILIRSDGKLKRDYFYVKDAVNAYITLAEHMGTQDISGEAFNFSSGEMISVLDMTSSVLDVMDRKDHPVEILNEVEGEIKDQYLSIEKARSVLAWSPACSLKDALHETVSFYSKHFAGQPLTQRSFR